MSLEKVKGIIIEQLGLEESMEIKRETSLMGDLEADSLDAVEIIMAIEDEFGIEILMKLRKDSKTSETSWITWKTINNHP